jgi:Tol biopolymer transport system component
MIAFTRPATPFGGVSDIYKAEVESGAPQKITGFLNAGFLDTSAVALQWLSDSTILASLLVDSLGFIQQNICELGLNGLVKRWVLPDTGIGYYSASISQGGERLAYLYNDRSGHTGVGIATADGKKQQMVAPELNYYLNQGFYESTPCWSPDGMKVAFSATLSRSFQPPFGSIYSVQADGSGFVEIVNDSISLNIVTDWR